jgi:ABC-type nitrate/sulfonate/bicarbonate transport system ATPase subunit
MMQHDLKEVLISVKDVSLSFEDRRTGCLKQILKPITVDVRDVVRPDCVTGQVVGVLGPSGIGKCLGRGTPVLMFDGSIKSVENVKQDDLLMGPDSKPKRVLSLGHGEDILFKIIPIKGEPFVVNSEHVLALHVCRHRRSRARKQNISVSDYLQESKTFKARSTLYRSECVQFIPSAVPIDPYFFGLWLGDGDTDEPHINTVDQEIVDSIHEFAQASGAEVSRYQYGKKCPKYRVHSNNSGRGPSKVLRALRSTNAMENKHIPSYFKVNDVQVRQQILAGLLDSDGSRQNNCFDFINKNESIARDVCYIARSLGLAAYLKPCIKRSQSGSTGQYFRVTISGHTDQIPVKILRKKTIARKQVKNVLHTGFSVTELGRGEYFGFELDGDGLFLLGDFTVTHNTQFSRILTGLQRPTTGSVSVEGKPVVPGLVGMVAQDYPLFRWRTVRGNLAVALEHSGLTKQGRRDRVTEYLARFGMADKADLYPSQLSGGQRQRIAIVRELLCSEHFVVMDEPFTGLDPINKDKVADLIVHVANSNEKNTIFVVAHDIAALVSISDTLWLFGRDRDEHGQPVQGAYVKKTYNLIERDLAWRPGISRTKEFFDFCSEVRTEFDDL